MPIIIKLTPQAWNVAVIAKAAETAGADAICAGNTISGMVIDVRAKKPILHNKQGGVSGPALFPIALKMEIIMKEEGINNLEEIRGWSAVIYKNF